MGVNTEGLAYRLAYNGIYLAFDGQVPGAFDESVTKATNIGWLDPAELATIKEGILELIKMTGEDVDGDGIVDSEDSGTIILAALDDYTLKGDDQIEIDGDYYAQRTLNSVYFHEDVRKKGSKAVIDFVWKFYKDIAESDGKEQRGGLLELWRKSLFEE
tara:strand:+ start:3107 stop:3583 length:477 start_codon:yes stop_codon:yes gene_type:complete